MDNVFTNAQVLGNRLNHSNQLPSFTHGPYLLYLAESEL